MLSFFKNIRLKKSVWIILLAGSILASIGFVEKKQREKVLTNVIVNINEEFDNYFIDEEEVINLITEGDEELIINQGYDAVNLKDLEEKIRAHHFVESAQVSRDHKGNLIIQIEQCRPIARILQTDGPDAYISDLGKLLNTSEKYTARVVIVDGVFTKKMLEPGFFSTNIGQPYYEFLTFISADKFWKTQIAQITIDRFGEMKITPQVGREVVEFGTPHDYESKLNKMFVFYKKVLPAKGWNIYDVVNVKYSDQIVCSKN